MQACHKASGVVNTKNISVEQTPLSSSLVKQYTNSNTKIVLRKLNDALV